MAEERTEIQGDFQDFMEASADANGYTKEFIELLKGLTEEEKREVKGILIGMQITRDRPLTA